MAFRDDVRGWWGSPAVRAMVFVLLATLVFHGLVLFGRLNSRDDAFVADSGFRLWAVMASFSFAVWIALLDGGVKAVRELPASWRRGRRWWLASLVSYAVLMVAASTMLRGVRQGHVPIDDFPALISLLTAVGAGAGAPWVLSVWLAQEQVRERTDEAGQGTDPDAVADPPDLAAAMADLLAVWRVIERGGLALSLIVSTSAFNTGALRLAVIGAGVTEPADFPPVYVLGHGAFFTAVLVAILLPLVLAWRARALALVERTLPLPASGLLDEDGLAARSRMEAQLQVSARFLRNPIALLSVLSPLVTALVTALVPSGA